MRLPILATAALALTLVAAPLAVRADVARAVDSYVLPGLDGFRDATAALSARAAETCAPEALRPAWNTAFDAWLKVGFLRLGPGEDQGRNVAIAFWPDPKGIGAKQQRQMIAAQDPIVNDPEAFADASVAVRGFFALERLLYPAEPLPEGPYVCALIRATTTDLARMGDEIDRGWRDGFAGMLLSAGQPGNTLYLSPDEAKQALFTQLMAGLEFITDQRLARPIGSFERPRPERAEARHSARGLRNIELSLEALLAFAQALAGPLPNTTADTATALATARTIGDPTLAGVADPKARPAIELLLRQVRTLRDTALFEVGDTLGVGTGFNSADGD